MSISDKRYRFFKDYKLYNNKESLKQLVLTFLPSVEKIVQKYDLSIQDTLTYIAVEAIIDCINNFDLENNINNLIIYVNKYINSRIQSYLKKERKNHIEFESLPLKGEDGTSYDMEFILNKMLIQQMFEYLDKKNESYSEILKLRYGLGYTLQEIAAMKNITFQAVKKKEDEAIVLLKKKFNNK